MNTKSQYGFELITVSDRLNEVIKQAIKKAKKENMDEKLELFKNKLEKLIEVTENLTDSKVVFLSQELDKLILNYYYLGGVESGTSIACGKAWYVKRAGT